ncbi:uncharacterized protein LOC117828943 isoform X2 [Notolabrus celidotus]|uniref:uncharacterized protein LOC117828943 isoform X2 n=1 Tax=Notolabrus celidotus TaxID=1203425 RepID=UPI00148FA0A9|nr:uncharacterized protein LOC117828943 isoform X2 [Notolabrus celidotus]
MCLQREQSGQQTLIMFCPYCGKQFSSLPYFCNACGKALAIFKEQGFKDDASGPISAAAAAAAAPNMPTLKTFLDYRKKKSEERQNFSLQKKGMKKKEPRKVNINIGIMCSQNDSLKVVRGRTLPLIVEPDIDALGLRLLAVKKMTDFNNDFQEGPYVLMYPDKTEVVTIPGTSRPFILRDYKSEIGKPYSRITLFICLRAEYEQYQHETSDTEDEICVRSRSAAEFDIADTLPWEPDMRSTPKNTAEKKSISSGASKQSVMEEICISDTDDPLEGTSGNTESASSFADAALATTAAAKKTDLYSMYTQLYAPIDDMEINNEDVIVSSAKPAKTPDDTGIPAAEIIQELAGVIDHKSVSRFNIVRSNVWDGAARGFRRSTFSEKSDLLVKFTDDAGSMEEGLDTGGPAREFLTLLISHLQSRPIFEGPPESRYLVYNPAAIREDEYFMAGKMIAVSIVHGGPGPHFLSRDLVNHIVGQPSFCANVKDVTDDEIGRALHEIESADSLRSLQDQVLKHSSLLQTAGCFQHVSNIEEKHTIVEDYLKWYIIGRNTSVIERFKDGLASLMFLEALCQHPAVLAPVLCCKDKKLTAMDIEELFMPLLSPVGSNKRRTESQVLSFWSDYIMDCEEQGPVSLEELLMFATGLRSLPPAGMTPHPSLSFLEESMYPMANTCSNTIKLPLLPAYDLFKKNMDFGIQNSPGFGCH